MFHRLWIFHSDGNVDVLNLKILKDIFKIFTKNKLRDIPYHLVY